MGPGTALHHHAVTAAIGHLDIGEVQGLVGLAIKGYAVVKPLPGTGELGSERYIPAETGGGTHRGDIDLLGYCQDPVCGLGDQLLHIARWPLDYHAVDD